MKIRSKENFVDFIQMDRAWRRRELTNIKFLIDGCRAHEEHTLIRCGVLILYSHWEGFIKKSCECFFHYLNFKGPKYSKLKVNLKALGVKEEFNGDFPHKKFDSYLKTINFLTNEANDKKFSINIEKNIDTKSNLNSEVLEEISSKVGINCNNILNNKTYIDAKLLKYRNAIAHGEKTLDNPNLMINKVDFVDLYNRMNSLVDEFESLILNHIEMEDYMDD